MHVVRGSARPGDAKRNAKLSFGSIRGFSFESLSGNYSERMIGTATIRTCRASLKSVFVLLFRVIPSSFIESTHKEKGNAALLLWSHYVLGGHFNGRAPHFEGGNFENGTPAALPVVHHEASEKRERFQSVNGGGAQLSNRGLNKYTVE